MTVNITISYMGQHLDLELERDGSFLITNRDVAWEQMLAAMSGDPTPAIVALDSLTSNLLDSVIAFALDYNVAQEEFTGTPRFVVGMMIDCLERLGRKHPKLEGLEEFIARARRLNDRFAFGFQAQEVLEKHEEIVDLGMSLDYGTHAAGQILECAQRMVNVVHWFLTTDSVSEVTLMNHLGSVLWYAASARAYVFSVDIKSQEWIGHHELERRWQARRLIHLMEAKQQKQPRPGVEETP